MSAGTRRGLLVVMGGAAIVAPVLASPSPSLDAELLAACADALRIGVELDRLCEVECDADEAGDKAAEDAAYKASLALVPGYLAAVERAAVLPAATAEGRRARARVLLRRVQRRADGSPCSLEDQVLASLCADVLHAEVQA